MSNWRQAQDKRFRPKTAGGTGPAGPAGPAGPGVPTGGTTGQYLRKVSATNYDTEWATLPSGGGGSGNSYFPGGW